MDISYDNRKIQCIQARTGFAQRKEMNKKCQHETPHLDWIVGRNGRDPIQIVLFVSVEPRPSTRCPPRPPEGSRGSRATEKERNESAAARGGVPLRPQCEPPGVFVVVRFWPKARTHRNRFGFYQKNRLFTESTLRFAPPLTPFGW